MAEAGAALAKDRAVEPLLQALEEPANTAARPAVNVLVSLTRVEDDRIAAALTDHLVNDPQVAMRSRIALGICTSALRRYRP